jgi:uncharacterized membrane protein
MRHDRQVHIEPEQLLALLRDPHLPQRTRERAYQLAFPKPDTSEWQEFLAGLFYTLGAALSLTGLLFLLKSCWVDWSDSHRCALFAVSTVLCAALAARRGVDNYAGKVSLSGACLLLGGFLWFAWPSAPSHLVLALWSVLILPACILAEFVPLWLFATVLFNLTVLSFCGSQDGGCPEVALLALNSGLLALWEFGFWQGHSWMGRRWFPPLLALAALGPITASGASLLARREVGLRELFPMLPLNVLAVLGLLFYYSRVRRDVSVLSLALGNGVVLCSGLLSRFALELHHHMALLVMAMGLLIEISMALGILRNLTAAIPAAPKAPPQEKPQVRIWLSQLVNEGLLKSQQIEDIELSLRAHNEAALPWFVKGLAGLGAFIASLFLLFYLLLEGVVSQHNGLGFGLGMCALACLLCGVMRSELLRQASLSLSLCGQLVVWLFYASGPGQGSPASTALVMAILELALVIAYPGAFGRFLSVNFCGLFFSYWLKLVAPALAFDLLVVTVAALVAFLWLGQDKILPVSSTFAPAFSPLAMGSVTLLFTFLLSSASLLGLLPNVGWVTALGLVLLTVRSAHEMGASPRVLSGLALVGLTSSSAPGVIAAVLVLLLGFYRRNQTLKGTAILFLLTFGSAYYYQLKLGLQVKSLVLMLSGAVLLALARSVEIPAEPGSPSCPPL